MTNRLLAKHKISRKLGVNLWHLHKDKSTFDKRPHKPGQRHDGMEKKLSDYGMQLMEKQKLRAHYGNIVEKQFKRFFVNAKSAKGDTGRNFVAMLERRLDAVVYRVGFAPTIFSAKQLVSHNHILVNGKRVNIPSYIIKEGDVVELSEKAKAMDLVKNSFGNAHRPIPSYFQADQFKVKLLKVPDFEEIPYPMVINLNLIVEWYSRSV
ncbi:30S ribosomal protein S4 [Candidatus Gromoviella agglomerans]|uniref:30S ribosomal protein S4 n=1 Tax=Candidatus Gromoviella agglomerans TaxID=2806609 RepID=UPI001E4FFD39|nr:30S ribosomal protein S4 [Candidatus Gromoviella agglomerans]UFX98411.1 30S ribosomal protein S4 [Candidatus Gromoviella agglomerans]